MKRLLLIPSAFEAARLLPDGAPRVAGLEVLVCGVGLLRAGLAVAARLQRGDVRDALLVGLCGTRDVTAAPVAALLVGSAVRNEAFGAGRAADFLGLREMGLRSEVLDPEVLPLAEPAVEAVPPSAVRGLLGSVAAASGSPDEARAWRQRHPDVLAEEMETYAAALACARAGVPLACVRAVSNVAGDRDMRCWDVAGSIGALSAALPALLAAPAFARPASAAGATMP